MVRDLSQLPVLNSEYLFRRLIALFDTDLVCDVGAFDGAHALRFVRPGTCVVALEANPLNADALSADRNVADAGIETYHMAAWNKDGDITFNVVDAPTGDAHEWRKQISSIRARLYPEFDSEQVTIRAVRLDSFVSGRRTSAPSSIALWIDVEGVAYEVLEGISGICDFVSVIHVEVETFAFWEGQHLWPDVLALMRDFGFSTVARSQGDSQCNVIFVNSTFRDKAPLNVAWLILLAWARRQAGSLRSRFQKMA